MPTENKAEGSVHFAYHAVAHIDLLGQSDALRRLDEVPLPCTEEQVLPAIRATLTPLVQLREFVADYFAKANAPSEILESLSPVERARADELRAHDVVIRSWSDTTVVTVPLRNEANPALPKVVGIYRTFVAVAGVMLAFLVHRKLMLRGGIDLGKALDIPPAAGGPATGEIYGAVIERAYTLESKVAQYPRIVIGDTLLRFLDELTKGESDADPQAQFNSRMAKRCTELLIRDPFDGRVMLDFLGAETRALAGVSADQLAAAREFVAVEQQRFIRERNDTLAVRYNRLLIYIDHALRGTKRTSQPAARR